jgi:hypothetical protein
MAEKNDKAEAARLNELSRSPSIPKLFLLKIWRIVSWTPPNCRWVPEKPPQFSMGLNILFAFASAFTVANLCKISHLKAVNSR